VLLGRHKIVDECFDFIEPFPGVKVAQVKEKFGGLRFYIHHGEFPPFMEREHFDKLDEIANKSFKTCELCGTQENVRTGSSTGRGWILTLCDTCREEDMIKWRSNRVY
jgi:hypothetical protein